MSFVEFEQLKNAYELKCAEITALNNRVSDLEDELERLKELLALQQKRRFGKKNEADPSPDKNGELQTVASYTRSRNTRGSRFDTSALPRHSVIHDLTDAQKQCAHCHLALHKIGQEVSEQVEIIPTRYCVIEHIRMKYGCRCCDKIIMAPKPPAPLPKCAAGASFLTDILVNKYQAHLPLYRQSRLMKNQNFCVPDNTLGNWVMQSGKALLIMMNALWEILKSNYLQVDETPVKVLDSEKLGYVWTYFTPHIGPGKGLVVFEFSETRAAKVVEERLKDFTGLLQTDGYSGYKGLRKRTTVITGFGCITHARRKFHDALKVSGDKKGIAHEMLERLKPLYALEARLREIKATFHTRKRLRQKIAYPILKEIHRWLRLQFPKVPENSQLGNAIDYALKQWPYLIAYTRHGEAEIDTNGVENKIRPVALGRRNWLFIGNAESGKIHALFFSLVSSCILNDLNPRVYLHYLLTQVHALRKKEIDPITLLPDRIDKKILAEFVDSQLEFAKTIINST